MSIHKPVFFALSCTLLLACAHTTPPELINARSAYERAANGPSTEYTPAELHVAKTSLHIAEQSFEDKDDEFLVRDRSYIAQRNAELAESLARTAMYKLGIAWDDEQEQLVQSKDAAKTKAELAATQGDLADSQGALADEQAAGARTQEELETQKQLRAEAEARAAKAAADLARIASVKQDDRGTVITLSGSVLFASNEFELLPGAQAKLSQVATALLEGDPAATFVVEGHTDSQGKSETNMTLSTNRANAVRDYLVQHEIAADRISAIGHGEARSVAENTSAEGRANNRRVELVVKAGKPR